MSTPTPPLIFQQKGKIICMEQRAVKSSGIPKMMRKINGNSKPVVALKKVGSLTFAVPSIM